MEYIGNIRKMGVKLEGLVQYQLPIGNEKVELNDYIGAALSLHYEGQINCIRCGRRTNKSFAQGYCYPCFSTAPETEECVLRPELCRAHEGIARDMDYATSHCLIPHVVYLSVTSGLKVGVTRETQVPVRWIDQGAGRVLELARTPNRYTAGLIELALKAHVADKTNWRRMLSGPEPGEIDLVKEKARLVEYLSPELQCFVSKTRDVLSISYPVESYPEKVRSLNFDKEPLVSGILQGIKGQYLMFDGSRVINIRKFGGYLLKLSL